MHLARSIAAGAIAAILSCHAASAGECLTLDAVKATIAGPATSFAEIEEGRGAALVRELRAEFRLPASTEAMRVVIAMAPGSGGRALIEVGPEGCVRAFTIMNSSFYAALVARTRRGEL